MLRYIFIIVVCLHGLIHFMGFAKAFGYGDIKNLHMDIAKPVGAAWMATAFLFIIVTILLFMKNSSWWMLAIPAVILSQIVIIMSWQDAKFGTIANIIILFAIITVFTKNFPG